MGHTLSEMTDPAPVRKSDPQRLELDQIETLVAEARNWIRTAIPPSGNARATEAFRLVKALSDALDAEIGGE